MIRIYPATAIPHADTGFRAQTAFYLINVAQPFTDVFEALGVGDVVDQHDTHGSSVVGGGDSVEPLLACCVPTDRNMHIQV